MRSADDKEWEWLDNTNKQDISKVIVVDDFLNDSMINLLSDKFLYQTPHMWGGFSNTPEDDIFYVTQLDGNDITLSYILNKVESEVIGLNINLSRVYINVQHNNMDGYFHYDDGDITALLMITPTPSAGGGFEYRDTDGRIKTIEYKKNRLIVFKDIYHRGRCYKDNKPRITLAYKLNISK